MKKTTSICIEQMPDYEVKLFERLDKKHQDLYLDMRQKVDEYLLDYVAMNIRFFTSHGKHHSMGVIRQLSNLLFNRDEREEYSSSELLILLCGAWLHDIGLLVNRDENGRELSDAEIRDQHHELAAWKIREIAPEFNLNNPNLVQLLADICACHRRSTPIEERLPQAERYIEQDLVRAHFLAALLRMADALDMDYFRASPMFEKIGTLNDDAKLHWCACQMIEVVYLPAEKQIHIDAAYQDSYKDRFADEGDDVNSEEFQRRIREEVRRLIYSKFADLCEEWESAIPYLREVETFPYEKLTLNITLPGLESSDQLPHQLEDSSIHKVESEPIEVISYLRNRKRHEKRQQLFFAADWDYQIARLYIERADKAQDKIEKLAKKAAAIQDLEKKAGMQAEIKKEEGKSSQYRKRAQDHYNHAANLVETWSSHTKSPDNGQYCWRALAEFYRLRALSIEDDSLTEHQLLKSISKIEGYLDYIENNLIDENIYWSIMMLLQSGRSPLRPKIRKFLDQFPQRLKEEGKGESVHGGCCLCTAELVAALISAGREKDVSHSIDWLIKQKQDQWRTCGKKRRDYHYTSMVLEAVLWAGMPFKIVKEVADCLIDNSDDWGKSAFERSPVEVHSEILYALAMYMLTFHKANKSLFNHAQRSQLSKRLTTTTFDYAMSYAWQRRELVAVFYIEDFQNEGVTVNLEHICKGIETKMGDDYTQYCTDGSFDPRKLIQKTIQDLQNDPVLNPTSKDAAPAQQNGGRSEKKNKQDGAKSIRLSLVKRWTQSWLQYLECEIRREAAQSKTIPEQVMQV